MTSSDMKDQWVGSAIRALKKTSAYQTQVMDDWYESLPVIQWEGGQPCIAIMFGRNASRKHGDELSTNPPARLPLEPHLTCLIRYPGMDMSWRVSPTSSQQVFLDQGSDTALPGPERPMQAARDYHHSLSLLLATLGEPPAQACPLAREAVSRLFKAAHPLLRSLYETTGQPLTTWMNSNCR